MKKFVHLYILTVCLTHAFNIHPWLPVPLIISSAFVVLLIAKLVLYPKTNIKKLFGKEDIIMLGLLAIMLISTVVNLLRMSPMNINQLWAYLTVILMFYFCVKMMFASVNITSQDVEKYLSIAVGYTALYITIEFVSVNFFSCDMSRVVYRSTRAEYSSLVLGRFIRARGWAAESGPMMLFFNLFAPTAIVNIDSRILRYGYIALLIPAYIFTYSKAGIGCLAISIMAVLPVYIMKRRKWKQMIILISSLTLLALLLTAIVSLWPRNAIFRAIRYSTEPLIISARFVMSSDVAGPRKERWGLAWILFLQHPFFGSGPGAMSAIYEGSAINLYLKILSDTGIFSFILLTAFWVTIFRRIYLLGGKKKYTYMVSYLACSIHYWGISLFWYPWIWLFIALTSLKHYEEHAKMWRSVDRYE